MQSDTEDSETSTRIISKWLLIGWHGMCVNLIVKRSYGFWISALNKAGNYKRGKRAGEKIRPNFSNITFVENYKLLSLELSKHFQTQIFLHSNFHHNNVTNYLCFQFHLSRQWAQGRQSTAHSKVRFVTRSALGMKVQCHFNICNNFSYLGYPDYSAAVELIPDKPVEKISHN